MSSVSGDAGGPSVLSAHGRLSLSGARGFYVYALQLNHELRRSIFKSDYCLLSVVCRI